MSRVLVKFGGTRIGDFLHIIPLLKKLKDSNFTVDVVYGWYEAGAAELLKHIGLIDNLYGTNFVDGPCNSDMTCILKFMESIGGIYDDMNDYDAVLKPTEDGKGGLTGTFTSDRDIGIDFNEVPWCVNEVPNIIVGNYIREDDYIGVQAASISRFKIYSPLYGIDYPGDVKSFGFMADRPIENAIKIHGKTLIDVYEELMTCCMVVSTHSTIGILAYYLGIPQIFIHFWKQTGAKLVKKDTIISLHEPGLSELQEEIDNLYKKLN